MKRYEGMFLFDSAVAHEWSAIQQEVDRLCGRIGAQLDVCLKFDERKLAYEIGKRKRGTYVLTYFEAPPERIADLERDVQLSELVLRMLVLRANDVTEEKLAELRAWPPDSPYAPLSTDSRHGDGRDGREGRWGGRPRRDDEQRGEFEDSGRSERGRDSDDGGEGELRE